jgi:sugar lactone lactonase YvrE
LLSQTEEKENKMTLTRMIYALSIVVLLLAGCQSTQEVTTEEIIGQWDLRPEPGLDPVGWIQFYPDGTFSLVGLDSGRYELEGTTLTFLSSDSLICHGQDYRGIYQVERTEDGIHLLLEEDTCDPRSWALKGALARTPPELSNTPEPHKVPVAPTVVSVRLAPAAPVLDSQGTSASDANSVNDLLPMGDDLWVATDDGVLLWDLAEATCVQHTSEHGLASNTVSAIAVDGEGALWFGTSGGVSRFDGDNWTTYTVEDGLADNSVGGIVADREGLLWFGTSGGVSRFDGENWTTYTVADGLAHDWVTAIFVDGEGAIWIGTVGGGVSRFDGESWTTYIGKVRDGSGNAWAIAEDREGELWFGRTIGVSHFDGANWRTVIATNGPEKERVDAAALDREGVLWFGTEGRGASRFDGRRWATYTDVDGLASNYVKAIAVDGEGVLWFGTSDGVSRFDGQTWTTYAVEDVNGRPQ